MASARLIIESCSSSGITGGEIIAARPARLKLYNAHARRKYMAAAWWHAIKRVKLIAPGVLSSPMNKCQNRNENAAEMKCLQ